MEAVVQAGGYVVHQVTAAVSLKAGDQVQLHLDKVGSRFYISRWHFSEPLSVVSIARSTDCPA